MIDLFADTKDIHTRQKLIWHVSTLPGVHVIPVRIIALVATGVLAIAEEAVITERILSMLDAGDLPNELRDLEVCWVYQYVDAILCIES